MRKDSRRRSGASLVAVTAALLLVGACSNKTKTPTETPKKAAAAPQGLPPVPPGSQTVAEADPSAGEKLFNQNCSACHQIGGVGMPGLAPSIRNRDFLAIASDDFIRRTIAQGRPATAMVPRPDLKHQQVTEIIAYLRSLKVPNKPQIAFEPERKCKGDPKQGAEAFGTYCAHCHGEKGEGYSSGGAGPGIGLVGFLSVASDDYIFQTVKQGRLGTAMRSFSGARGLAHLEDQTINDIIVWLRSPR